MVNVNKRGSVQLQALFLLAVSGCAVDTMDRPARSFYCPAPCNAVPFQYPAPGVQYADQSSHDEKSPPVNIAVCRLTGSETAERNCIGPLQCSGASEVTSHKKWMIESVPVPVHTQCNGSMFRPVEFSRLPGAVVDAGSSLGPVLVPGGNVVRTENIFATPDGLAISAEAPSWLGISDGALSGVAPS
jgi:hypothetical protein